MEIYVSLSYANNLLCKVKINTPDDLKWTGLLSASKSLDSIVHYETKMLSGITECDISFYK